MLKRVHPSEIKPGDYIDHRGEMLRVDKIESLPGGRLRFAVSGKDFRAGHVEPGSYVSVKR